MSTKPRAAGIGLIVAREIIASHKGLMNLHSVDGGGPTIIVSLPLHRAVATQIVQEDHAPAPHT